MAHKFYFTSDIASKSWNVTAPDTIVIGSASVVGDIPGDGPETTDSQHLKQDTTSHVNKCP